MDFTVIAMGRLEFNNLRGIKKAKETTAHLLETRYKHEALYKDIEIFDEELLAFIAPRQKFSCTEKTWQNTVHLLTQAAQFAVAGDIRLWKVKEGKLQIYERVEPRSEKSTTQAYLRGRKHLKNKEYQQAQDEFTTAIDKFDRHAMAMECRAFTHYALGDTDKALADYAASIAIDSKRPEAYLGRATIAMSKKEWKEAVVDLTLTMKRSMPHHDVYLEALHRKGKCLMELGEFDDAIKDFNFFLSRPLLKDHPQYPFRRQVSFDKGKALAAQTDFKEAINFFNDALELPGKDNKPVSSEILLHRGLAKQKIGKKAFLDDWKEAADQGSKRAAELLAIEAN